MTRLGVITGSRREAACLRAFPQSDRLDIACSGADANRARALSHKALESGCTALLSFGVAGGLAPSLASGALVVAGSIIGPDHGEFETDPDWRSAVTRDLAAARIDFVEGAVAGSDEPVSFPADKQALYDRNHALCVDMESHAVAQAALERRVPCLVIRAVVDSADDVLPDIAMAAIDELGKVRYGGLAARLLRRPSEVSDLLRLARISRPAFVALGRVALLPGFGGPL